MAESFGQLLQEKNYLRYCLRKLQLNRLWQKAEKYLKYLGRILWIRRLFTIAATIVLFLEQGIVFLTLFSVTVFFLPILCFSALLRLFFKQRQFRALDRKILGANRTILLWTHDWPRNKTRASFVLECAKDFAQQGMIVILIGTHVTRYEKQDHVFLQDVSYFFHLRKKLRAHPEIPSVLIYE